MSCYKPKYRDRETGSLVETDVCWCDEHAAEFYGDDDEQEDE